MLRVFFNGISNLFLFIVFSFLIVSCALTMDGKKNKLPFDASIQITLEDLVGSVKALHDSGVIDINDIFGEKIENKNRTPMNNKKEIFEYIGENTKIKIEIVIKQKD